MVKDVRGSYLRTATSEKCMTSCFRPKDEEGFWSRGSKRDSAALP